MENIGWIQKVWNVQSDIQELHKMHWVAIIGFEEQNPCDTLLNKYKVWWERSQADIKFLARENKKYKSDINFLAE